nr:uncharacterized protein LOC113740984 [Coffea arabica]
MEGRRSGQGCGRGTRQAQSHGNDQGSATGPTHEQENVEGNQVTTVINRMTDILERLAERQGPGPLSQTRGQDRGEDRALERFLKFNPPKFIGEPDFEIRRFVQGFNVKIHEGLVAAQISTFTETLEKAQRVESARMQVKDFHNRKKNFSSRTSGQTSKSSQPSKIGRGMGGIMIAGVSRGVLSRGGHSGQVQVRGAPSSGSAVTPQISCGYCEVPSRPFSYFAIRKYQIDEALTYEEKPVKLRDSKVKELRNKRIPLVKVLWRNYELEEATWEVE